MHDILSNSSLTREEKIALTEKKDLNISVIQKGIMGKLTFDHDL